MARFVPGKQEEAVAYLSNLYKEMNDNAEFPYSLLEDDIARLYEEDKRVSNVYVLFALLAIFISCMGLFALSLFDIRQRYREIALRKVNGATTRDISRLLLKKYVQLLAVAFAIAVPAALVVIHKYLEGFAHKAPVSWWLFAIAGVTVVAISLLTLVWQVQKAMKIDPAKVLKGE
ncbi:FtsX-like permease family protein [uncultured Proteiniphilum sp.]|uniref:ABC transporter permease n=1 Tax=uncultured Proteiniphilum sp. TaxID=497637 RepID=UPI00261880D1|nr:FtsX-like permease family protein [uncultured Proteiniphilum sp.]